MLTDERLAEIDEKLTDGEYPQPMEVLRIAQELAEEVERARGAERALLLRLNTHHASEGTFEVRVCQVFQFAQGESSETLLVLLEGVRSERDQLRERNFLLEQNQKLVNEAQAILGMPVLGNTETFREAAARVVGERDHHAFVVNEYTETTRRLREDLARTVEELGTLRASHDMLTRAVETARTAGPVIDAEIEDPAALALGAFVTGISTGGDGMVYELEDIGAALASPDFGRPRRAAVHISVRLPSVGDEATARAQWLASHFRRPVVVTFSDPREEEDVEDGEVTGG